MRFIILPPVRDYKNGPKGQTGCTKMDCPKCFQESWVSAKKRTLLDAFKKMDIEYFAGCYTCFELFATQNPDIIVKTPMIRID